MYKLIFFLVISTVNHAATVDEMLKTRQEVEVLAQEVQAVQKSFQSQMDVYIQEDQELEAKLLQEKLKTIQIQKTSEFLLKQNQQKTIKSESNTLPFERFVINYQNYLNKLLPAEKAQSTEKIEKIVFELKSNKLTYEQALLQTWFLLENDLRSSQEVSFLLTQIDFQGKQTPVEMIKLGRNLAYIRTTDKQYALINEQRPIDLITSSTDQKNIEVLFTQIKKDQKTGIFELPLLSKVISR
jgi:hypothetical protein